MGDLCENLLQEMKEMANKQFPARKNSQDNHTKTLELDANDKLQQSDFQQGEQSAEKDQDQKVNILDDTNLKNQDDKRNDDQDVDQQSDKQEEDLQNQQEKQNINDEEGQQDQKERRKLRQYKTGYKDDNQSSDQQSEQDRGTTDNQSNRGTNNRYDSDNYQRNDRDEYQGRGYGRGNNRGLRGYRGYNRGYDRGYDRGNDRGNDRGYDRGYDRGNDRNQRGYDSGYQRGYENQRGYDNGNQREDNRNQRDNYRNDNQRYREENNRYRDDGRGQQRSDGQNRGSYQNQNYNQNRDSYQQRSDYRNNDYRYDNRYENQQGFMPDFRDGWRQDRQDQRQNDRYDNRQDQRQDNYRQDQRYDNRQDNNRQDNYRQDNFNSYNQGQRQNYNTYSQRLNNDKTETTNFTSDDRQNTRQPFKSQLSYQNSDRYQISRFQENDFPQPRQNYQSEQLDEDTQQKNYLVDQTILDETFILDQEREIKIVDRKFETNDTFIPNDFSKDFLTNGPLKQVYNFRTEFLRLSSYHNMNDIRQKIQACRMVNQSHKFSEHDKFLLARPKTGDFNLHKAIKYGIWTFMEKRIQTVQQAYRENKNVYLIFLPHGSAKQEFMIRGLARIVTNFNHEKHFQFWDKELSYFGVFHIEWLYIKNVPTSRIPKFTYQSNNKLCQCEISDLQDCSEIYWDDARSVLRELINAPDYPSLFDYFSAFDIQEDATRYERTKSSQFTDRLKEESDKFECRFKKQCR